MSRTDGGLAPLAATFEQLQSFRAMTRPLKHEAIPMDIGGIAFLMKDKGAREDKGKTRESFRCGRGTSRASLRNSPRSIGDEPNTVVCCLAERAMAPTASSRVGTHLLGPGHGVIGRAQLAWGVAEWRARSTDAGWSAER